LRRESTPFERKLWQKLQNRQLAGYKFVRQEPIGPYIADFVCRERMLIVELDVGQHAESPRDARRDEFLALNGYQVKRFWNGEIEENLDGVLETILHLLHKPE
jgi:very-short-patch-repair endonuclease